MNVRDPVTKNDLELTERDKNGIGKSYFPIRIRYEGANMDTIVNHPREINPLVGFVVKKVRVGQ